MTQTQDLTPTSHPMHLTVDPWWGNLEVLAFGTVTDGLPGERFATIDEAARAAFVLADDFETVTGFVVRAYNDADDPFDPEDDVFWQGPRFDVPVLGLTQATAGEVILAVQGRFEDDEPTADAMHFHLAIAEDDPAQAVGQWRLALEAGDMKAHFGLGYTLCALERYREAYDHLRRYTELVPTNAWAWCWLGQACEGLGELTEARAAYARAVEEGEEETDAAERLEELEG